MRRVGLREGGGTSDKSSLLLHQFFSVSSFGFDTMCGWRINMKNGIK